MLQMLLLTFVLCLMLSVSMLIMYVLEATAFVLVYRTLSDDYRSVRARVGRLHLHEYMRSSHFVVPVTVS